MLCNDENEHNECLELIKALVVGNKNKLKSILGNELNFLSEIVNNTFCEIDVDKVDYLLRDCYHLGKAAQIDVNFKAFLDGSILF